MKNRCINLRGRLRLFAATVSPTVLYGLNTVPMTAAMQSRLDILQRKMLRSIIGWRIDPELDWEENGRRMKRRMERAQASFFMADWSESLAKAKLRLLERLDGAEPSSLLGQVWHWNPFHTARANLQLPFRNVGHPRARWEDDFRVTVM